VKKPKSVKSENAKGEITTPQKSRKSSETALRAYTLINLKKS
jgi:hypothetical protein